MESAASASHEKRGHADSVSACVWQGVIHSLYRIATRKSVLESLIPAHQGKTGSLNSSSYYFVYEVFEADGGVRNRRTQTNKQERHPTLPE